MKRTIETRAILRRMDVDVWHVFVYRLIGDRWRGHIKRFGGEPSKALRHNIERRLERQYAKSLRDDNLVSSVRTGLQRMQEVGAELDRISLQKRKKPLAPFAYGVEPIGFEGRNHH